MTARDTVNARIPEWKLQEHCVSELQARQRAGYRFEFAAGLEGVRLHPSLRAKMRAQGMQAGEPDLRFYLARGRLILIELKADGGRLSDEQKDRHTALGTLGFEVHTVKAKTPEECWAAVWAILEPRL